MNEISDETDKFTGHRSIIATLQDQIGSQPSIVVNALIFGDSEPLISGAGSFQMQMSWLAADDIAELFQARQSVQYGQAAAYENFHWLVSGRPEKIGSVYQIVKMASSDLVPESLGFFVSVTVDELRRVAFAKSVECRLDALEFDIGQEARLVIAQAVSLIGDVKTTEQIHQKALENVKPASVSFEGNPAMLLNHAESIKSVPRKSSFLVPAILFGILFLFFLSKCGSNERSNGLSRDGQVEACVARGLAYFRDVGSYPTLKSAPNAGRSAIDVARERCNRTTTAF